MTINTEIENFLKKHNEILEKNREDYIDYLETKEPERRHLKDNQQQDDSI